MLTNEGDDEIGLRTVASTARFLGLGRTKVYEMCDSGELEAVKIGRKSTRITQASINLYIKNAQRVKLGRKLRHPPKDS
jgi:excisionase family DNA binding protein